MSLSGTDGCQHAGPTNSIPESQPSGQHTQTDPPGPFHSPASGCLFPSPAGRRCREAADEGQSPRPSPSLTRPSATLSRKERVRKPPTWENETALTDSRSRHTIKRSFRPSDQVSSTPIFRARFLHFTVNHYISRSASVRSLGQGASSHGQKKFTGNVRLREHRSA